MKLTHVLGHNSNWNIDSYFEQNIGDYFLITAYTHGIDFLTKKRFQKIHDISMVDLQFYGKNTKIDKKSLKNISFHPINADDNETTNVYFDNCVKQAINFQKENNFKNIIIPHFYENEKVKDLTDTIKKLNDYISKIEKGNHKYFMTLPFAHHFIIDDDKVEEILFACTDMDIKFDGFFVACENKPDYRRKITTDIKILRNLSRVFKTLKQQEFETIYAYANWDSMIYLAQTDIDYITIGTYENLRNFDIRRFTVLESGGGSKGYYFSEKLLNMIRADDVTNIRAMGLLNVIRNERNIFSDIILKEGFPWNIHKPEVNKNYLLAISKILNKISTFENIDSRKTYVLKLIDNAIANYKVLEDNNIFLDNESSNYHLNTWKTYLSNS
jgi:hypothetical protein